MLDVYGIHLCTKVPSILPYRIDYSEMVVPTSNYWNIAHGTAPGEVTQDAEGMQIMSVLGKNMAWVMKSLDASKDIVKESEAENKIFTNFIR